MRIHKCIIRQTLCCRPESMRTKRKIIKFEEKKKTNSITIYKNGESQTKKTNFFFHGNSLFVCSALLKFRCDEANSLHGAFLGFRLKSD